MVLGCASFYSGYLFFFFFFFQAEDGIRDYKVTGVQTCALPISVRAPPGRDRHPRDRRRHARHERPRARGAAGSRAAQHEGAVHVRLYRRRDGPPGGPERRRRVPPEAVRAGHARAEGERSAGRLTPWFGLWRPLRLPVPGSLLPV